MVNEEVEADSARKEVVAQAKAGTQARLQLRHWRPRPSNRPKRMQGSLRKNPRHYQLSSNKRRLHEQSSWQRKMPGWLNSKLL